MRMPCTPDPLMKKTLQECIDDFTEWEYYDNFQTGEYVNQNDRGYGKIMVWNGTVHIKTEKLNPTEKDEKYKDVWGHYENSHYYFRGDVSERRLNYLIELYKKFQQVIKIEIKDENGNLYKQIFAEDREEK